MFDVTQNNIVNIPAFDYFLCKMNNIQSFGFEIIISSLFFVFVLVPIFAITLKCNMVSRNKKVDRVSTAPVFLNVVNIDNVKSIAHNFFKFCLRIGFTVTRERTKLSIIIRRKFSKLCTARLAADVFWRSAAFFRAIFRFPSFFAATENFTTPHTSMLNHIRGSAFPATYCIPVGNATRYRKFLVADGACFYDSMKVALTLARTKPSPLMRAIFMLFRLGWGQIELFSAKLAVKIFPTPFSLWFREFDFIVCHWHSAIILRNITVCQPRNVNNAR